MTSSFNNLVSTVDHMLNSLTDIHGTLSKMEDITTSTSDSVNTTKGSIVGLQKITHEIEEMVTFINEIADKTHVLSISSNIEAANSGESGKG